MSTQTEFTTWAIVELMGHVRLAGRLSEEERFGAKIGRLDIPTTEKCGCPNAQKTSAETPTVPCERCHGAGYLHAFVTQYFGGSSVYRITVVSEDVARHVARSTQPAPVAPWDFPKQALPAPASGSEVIDADYEIEDDPGTTPADPPF